MSRGSMSKRVVSDPNPWLKIEHNHDWLPANDGKELVCGLCGERQDVTKKEK